MMHSTLEKLIKLSSPFANPYYKAVVGILYLESRVMQDLDDHLSKFKLTYQQFNILRILKGQYPRGVQLSLLKDRMLHKQSDVSRLVSRLEKLGLVQKNENDLNKRKLSITLSDAGMKLIQSIDVADEKFKSVLSNLSPAEIDHLNILFDKVFVHQLPQMQVNATD